MPALIHEIILNGKSVSGKMLAEEFDNFCFFNFVYTTFDSPGRNFLRSPSKNSIFINPTKENEILGIF